MSDRKSLMDIQAGFPKVSYRVSSRMGSIGTFSSEDEAVAYAEKSLDHSHDDRSWVAIDRITVDRIFAMVKE